MKVLRNLSYGPNERNVLDVYLAENKEEPTPMLIFFHGGGYLTGDKQDFQQMDLMQECLDAGISVASCNYRFIDEYPFPAPMNDGTRAIQYVRSMAEEWGIDPERIVTAGSSAGGHIALWNALKGELADPDSSDEVERQSSIVSAFIGFGTQISKDQRFYKDIYEGPHIQPNLTLYYGVDAVEDLWKPETLKLAETASAITYVSSQAPPVFLVYDYEYTGEMIPKHAPVNEVIHHPVHGYQLKKEYDRLQIPCVVRHSGSPVRRGEIISFIYASFT